MFPLALALDKYTMYAKLGIVAILLLSIGSAGWMTKLYFKSDAERKMAIESFDNYKDSVQSDAIENNQRLRDVNTGYQKARDIKDENMATFEGHDLTKIITDKPGVFDNLAYSATDRLFSSIEANSRPSTREGKTTAP